MKFLALALVCLITAAHCRAALEYRFQFSTKLESLNACSEIAVEGSAPWQVSVQNPHGDHICSGAIIDNAAVLTAASCVAGLDPRDLKVLTGTNTWMNATAAKYEVDKIIIHCNYDKPLYHNDVALIKLAKSVDYNEKTQNITLAHLDELEEGDILTMTGWGSPTPCKPLSEKLKISKLKYIDNAECSLALGDYGDSIDFGNLCGLPEEGEGACHGDIGGPVVNSEGQLVGIGNWRIPGVAGLPFVLARVSFYSGWIRSSLNGCSLV